MTATLLVRHTVDSYDWVEVFASDSAPPEVISKGGVRGAPDIASLESSEQLNY